MRWTTTISILTALSTATLSAAPPPTEKRAVTDTYHDVEVTEDYRWLEDWDDPNVWAWSNAQNHYARSVLKNLPHVDNIHTRVREIMSATTERYGGFSFRNGRFFATKFQPPKQQSFLITMTSLDSTDSVRVLVDPNELDPNGKTSVDWFVPSPDAKLVAVSLSQAGTESGDVEIYEVASGKRVHEVVPRVNGGTAGGDLAWSPDGAGFFYTRYPRGNERPPEDMNFYQQLYYHKLGTPTEEDRYELGKDLPRIAEIQLDMDHRTGRLLVTVQKGDGGEFAHYLRSPDGKWRQFSEYGDKTLQAAFGPKDDLFVVSRAGAPRGRILRVPIDELNVSKAKVVIPEGEDAIVSEFGDPPTVLPAATRLYVEYQLGGPSEIRVFDFEGRRKPAPRQLPVSSVGGLTQLNGDDVLYANSSFIEPQAWYVYHARDDKTVRTPFASQWPVDFGDVEVVREFATSKDGTKVPVNIIKPKNVKRDGTNPCIATGYGGFGVNITPRFSATRRILLDQGIIYAVANLRGGNEYGEKWHRQGNLTNKQNVFDDFAAVCKHLIDRKYTNSDRLAIMGGSNGGLLMGALMTQHPKLVKAVVSYVGLYDMIRYELSPNGAFNIPEFGTVQNPEQFKAMYAYSPYHNVKDGTPYPATLFLTGANDPRVDPMQSRKMTARLQAATSSDAPILLRTTADAGHGAATLDQRIAQTTHVYAFLFDQLGIKFKAGTENSEHRTERPDHTNEGDDAH